MHKGIVRIGATMKIITDLTSPFPAIKKRIFLMIVIKGS